VAPRSTPDLGTSRRQFRAIDFDGGNVLARGTYTEQYMLTGVFFWLMAWRVLAAMGWAPM
jgi:hypothetical protein